MQWKLTKKNGYNGFKVHMLSSKVIQYVCNVGLIVYSEQLRLSVFCDEQSMATNARPCLRDEEQKPSDCDITRCGALLVTHMVRQDSHLGDSRRLRSTHVRLNHESRFFYKPHRSEKFVSEKTSYFLKKDSFLFLHTFSLKEEEMKEK